MIGILHGYLLEGSGSNLWTRSVVRALCRTGATVHLVCQENQPQTYDFIAEARAYHPDGRVEVRLEREVRYPGRCVLHKPILGDTLPVYVPDRYDEFERVVPMVELPDDAIEAYLARNERVVRRVVEEHGLRSLHANHAVLMSVVAQRVAAQLGVPFAVMPHGSAIEYAVKKDARFMRLARDAFAAAARIYVIGAEMRERVGGLFGELPGLDGKLMDLNLGVDTDEFERVPRRERARSVQRVGELLQGRPRGRTPAHTARVREAVRRRASDDALPGLLDEPADYDPKLPDAGVEARLAAVDWALDPVVLFVGRLIAAKGPHCVLAALPAILAREPRTRLLIVGHGPLRPALEAMVGALADGDEPLLRALLQPGLPGARERGLPEVGAYLARLEATGELDRYLEQARELMRPDAVVFTGYLTHRELRHLFPACDVAVFPSIVREAGPLVFLEALASGCYPLGTYFGGMAASIDAAALALPPGEAEWMKLSPEPERIVVDIAERVPHALTVPDAHHAALRELAVRRYDWTSVADRLHRDLEALAQV